MPINTLAATIENRRRKFFCPIQMDEFSALWAAEEEAAAAAEPLNEETPEYMIRNGIARYELLASILLHYYHAKHGEPMGEIIAPREVEFSIRGEK